MEVHQEMVVTTFKSTLRDMDVEDLARETVKWIQACRESRHKAREAQHKAAAEKKW